MANELITGIGVAGAGAMANTIAGETAQRRQKELMSIQLKNQQQLNKQGAALQMDMWNKTNYAAQVKHMKEAGLSAGLMYGKGGAGGTTTGSQSGGSAASGNAPQRAQMGIEGLMAGHQMELMKAQARKLNVDADKTEGADTDLAIAQKLKTDKDTAKLIQETTNLKTIDEINQFEKGIKKAEKERTDKGFIKNDTVGNLLNATGLDPVNNPEHRVLLNGMLGVWFGSKIAKDLMSAIMAIKPSKGGFKQPPLKNTMSKGNVTEWSVK